MYLYRNAIANTIFRHNLCLRKPLFWPRKRKFCNETPNTNVDPNKAYTDRISEITQQRTIPKVRDRALREGSIFRPTYQTFRQLVQDQCQIYDNKYFLKEMSTNSYMTYGDLKRHSDALALGLWHNGGTPGYDFVTVVPLKAELMVLLISISMVNRYVLTVLPPIVSDPSAFVPMLLRLNPSSLLFTPRIGDHDQLDLITTWTLSDPQVSLISNFPNLRNMLHTHPSPISGLAGFQSLHLYQVSSSSSSDLNALNELAAKEDPENLCSRLIFGYDTINFWKEEVYFTAFSLINTATEISRALEINARDILCATIPFHTGPGQVLSLGLTLTSKIQMVVPSEIFDPMPTLYSISKERCTIIQGFYSYFKEMLSAPYLDTFDLSSLKKAIVLIMPSEEIPTSEFIKNLKTKLRLTSVLVCFASNRSSIVLYEKDYQEMGKFTQIFDGTSLRITSGLGQVLPHNTLGYLQFIGYNTDQSRSRSQDKWQFSNALASMDKDGSVTLHEFI
eukprot:TRINITY_DN4210_c0_g3_i2.p1 TRINITY_DN4210_c0_g3~~TRINITY_DN4210_c0_g3_i2.p1  ORF type:complete len:505 (+),score=50.08 TRINITY_DN4210_c0_g3_i2:90-1604(+)